MASGKWAEFDANRVTERRERTDKREREAYEKAVARGAKYYSFGSELEDAGGSGVITKKITEYGSPIGNLDGSLDFDSLNDDEFNRYLGKTQLSINRQQQLNRVTNPGSSTTKSNEYGGDWLNSNSNFGYDNLKTMAKDLATQQLETQDKLMGLSYGYRTKEKDLDSTIRQRENDQKFGFEKTLQDLSNTQQLKVQANQYGQEQTMFDKGTTADTQKTESARRAASGLFYGRRSY
jgi:hypothetical protein